MLEDGFRLKCINSGNAIDRLCLALRTIAAIIQVEEAVCYAWIVQQLLDNIVEQRRLDASGSASSIGIVKGDCSLTFLI